MTWTVDQTERFGGVARAPRINPYLPGRTERLGTTSDNPRFSTKDIGKPVKLSGDTCVLCADGNEIYGVIEAVNAGTSDGYSIGTVLCDPGHEVLAVDEVGDLVVGDLVTSGTPTAVGTQTPTLGANVKKVAAVEVAASGDAEDLTIPAAPIHRWIVMAYYGAQAAGKQVMLRKV